jgi:hypothetical protein
MTLTQLAVTAAVLALWTGVLLWRDRLVVPAVTATNIKFTHVLPTVLQGVLFLYWGFYWFGVIQHLPVVVAQLVVAYAIDFLLAWTLQRRYTPSLGPGFW